MDEKICPCEPLPSELTISNPPGRDSIAYRVGDFNSIRRALLSGLPNETELTNWRPNAQTDLAIQMIEWWAYLGDILTFYNERIANQAYLRTSDLPESVRRLVGLLGYRPRPGIAATGVVAALIAGKIGFTIPKGFSIDSKPGPGQDPQTFELDKDTTVAPNEAIAANPAQFLLSPTTNQFLISGENSQVRAGDSLLLVSKNPAVVSVTPVLLTVTATQVEVSPANVKQTRVTFTASGSLPAPLPAKSLRIQRSTQSIGLWTTNGTAVSGSTVHLSGVARQIHAGDLVVFTAPNTAAVLATVSATQDDLWYLNPPGADPSVPPVLPAVPIGVLHTVLTVSAVPTAAVNTVNVLFGWQNVTPLIDQAPTSFNGAPPSLIAVEPAKFRNSTGGPILIEDDLGLGVAAVGAAAGDDTALTVSGLPTPAPSLNTPLKVLYNLLSVTRGKTVANEILGSGNAIQANQEFVLQKSPVTYLAKGDGYTSTISIWVNGRLWTEAPSFYGQPANAEVFVTAEDDDQKTHIKFGDGINGARLPTGTNNVVAAYRYGSGADSPPAGKLTVISKPFPNVKSVRNPVPVGGGADPDPADQIRKYAPRSVLTFGRAVSADDYEVIAAQSPGVNRARSYWSFDSNEQRAVVTVYVGDDQAALTSAKTALAATGDPNRHVSVVGAAPIPVLLALLILVDPKYVPTDVAASVRDELLDSDKGLFGTGRPGIGEAVFHSQISEACLRAEGAVSLRASIFLSFANNTFKFEFNPRHDPGKGAFYQIQPQWLWIFTEVNGNAG